MAIGADLPYYKGRLEPLLFWDSDRTLTRALTRTLPRSNTDLLEALLLGLIHVSTGYSAYPGPIQGRTGRTCLRPCCSGLAGVRVTRHSGLASSFSAMSLRVRERVRVSE
jgi:hypothetical protein